jgi:hypothetical protein
VSITYLQAQAHAIQQQLVLLPPNSVEAQQLKTALHVVTAQLRSATGGIRNLTF